MPVRFYAIRSTSPAAEGLKYVGRTTRDLEEKLNDHIKRERREPHRRNPLVEAIRTFGSETFVIELLDELPDGSRDVDIAHRELELMLQHDAIRNGWNRPSGSVGSRPRVRIIDPEEKEMSLRERWDSIRGDMFKLDELFKNPTRANRVEIRRYLRKLLHDANRALAASLALRPVTPKQMDEMEKQRLISEIYGT